MAIGIFIGNSVGNKKSGSYLTKRISNLGGAGTITPAQLSALTLKEGMTILFNKGETFDNFTLNVNVDNVTIDSYGTGAAPNLSGSSVIATGDWTSEGAGVYSITKAGVKWLYLDDAIVEISKTNWVQVNTRPSTNQIQTTGATTTYLNTFTNLVGKKLRHICDGNYFFSMEYTITGYNNGLITLNRDRERLTGTNYFIIYNYSEFLANEKWTWDGTTLKLKTAKTIGDHVIRVGLQDVGINITGNNCTIQNIELKHYQECAIKGYDKVNNILNNIVHDCRGHGIYITGNNWTGNINDNSVYNIDANGIRFGSVASGNCKNNEVYNIGVGVDLGFPIDPYSLVIGTGINFDGDPNEPIIQPDSLVIEGNVVHDTGWDSIKGLGDNHTIEKNLIYNFQGVFDDGAAISTWSNGTTITCDHVVVKQNIIHTPVKLAAWSSIIPNTRCVGIYTDYGCSDHDIDGNIIYDGTVGSQGIFFYDYVNNVRVCNNIVKDFGTLALTGYNSSNVKNLKIYDNVFYSSQATLISIFSSYYSDGGYLDRNTYINPTYNNILKHNGSSYILSAWQTATGQDANSSSIVAYTTPVVNDVLLYTNETDSAVDQAITAGYNDILGVPTTSKILQPFTGILVLKTYLVLRDIFPGTTIDTSRWTVTDPNGIISQGTGRIIFTLPHTGTKSGNILSIPSIASGVAVVSGLLDWTTPSNLEANGGLKLQGSANDFAAICTASTLGNHFRLLVYNGSTYPYIYSTTTDQPGYVKIWTDGTSIKFYVWNAGTSAWVQLGATQTFSLAYPLKYMIYGVDSAAYTGANPIRLALADLCNSEFNCLRPI